MKVLVAGGTGFVGGFVVAALRQRGHAVVVLSRGMRSVPAGAEAVSCDLARESPPLRALGGCVAIVNLVGIKAETGRQTFEGSTWRRRASCSKRAGASG